MSAPEQFISSAIVSWYKENARDLPWRKTKDAYLIWVSEIILQQTTVRQGLEYYKRFIKQFPNVALLAKANEDEVLNLWAGLGYYSRARNMHFTAGYVLEHMGGIFPTRYDELIKLKGIGPYTAAAISSFASNEARSVVDGNVIRLIARVFGIREDVSRTKTINQIKAYADKLLSFQEAELFNQAVMEFGALQCTFRAPGCNTCVLKSSCHSFKNNIVGNVPLKGKKLKKKSRFFRIYHIIDSNKNTIIEKRTGNDIWKGLYQFPLVEIHDVEKPHDESSPVLDLSSMRTRFIKTYKQLLTHQKINAEIHHILLDRPIDFPLSNNQQIVSNESLDKYPFPKFIDWYLNDNSIPLF